VSQRASAPADVGERRHEHASRVIPLVLGKCHDVLDAEGGSVLLLDAANRGTERNHRLSSPPGLPVQ